MTLNGVIVRCDRSSCSFSPKTLGFAVYRAKQAEALQYLRLKEEFVDCGRFIDVAAIFIT